MNKPAHKTIIDANKKSIVPDFKELYQYKDLFLTLAWRDFVVSTHAKISELYNRKSRHPGTADIPLIGSKL